MNPVLEWLGISPEVQAFFHADELRFDYGGVTEVYGPGFHYVPTTHHLHLAGSIYAAEVIVTHSVMEAVAWYAVFGYRYGQSPSLAFVSLGNLPQSEQLKWLGRQFKRRKLTLVFGNDLLGRLTDIFVACTVIGKPVRLSRQKTKTQVSLSGRSMLLEDDDCSLHDLEKVFGLRTNIRTSKPLHHGSFLMQLQNDACQPPPP